MGLNKSIKNGVAILKPTGYLDGESAESNFRLDEIEAVKKQNIKACLVSLSDNILFNSNAIAYIERVLGDIGDKGDIVTGFCEYDDAKYKLLQKFLSSESRMSLFESEAIARLFIEDAKEKKRVLIRVKSPLQRGMILLALHEKGHIPVVASEHADKQEESQKSSKEATIEYIDTDAKSETEDSCVEVNQDAVADEVVSDENEDEKFDMVVSMTKLPIPALHISSYIKSNSIVYTLNGFLDSHKMSEFDRQYFKNSLKIGFRLFVFECSDVTGINAHAVNYLYSLAVEAAQYGAVIVMTAMDKTKITNALINILEQAAVVFMTDLDSVFNDKELLKKTAKAESISVKDASGPNKELIKNLPHFSFSVMDTIETMTGSVSKKISTRLGKLDLELFGDDYIATSLGFYGYISGIMILVYHKDIAKKMCDIFFGIENIKDDDISDAICEMLNIMAGKTKSHLAKMGVSINITLPKTFTSKEEFASFVNSKKGAIVEFELHKNKFFLFLCS